MRICRGKPEGDFFSGAAETEVATRARSRWPGNKEMRSKRKMRAFLMARREGAMSAGFSEIVKVKFDVEGDSFVKNPNMPMVKVAKLNIRNFRKIRLEASLRA